jgi:outer membrane immunogenic protein
MNKTTFIITAAIAALLSTTVAAQDNAGFTGVRGELSAGVVDVKNDRDVEDFRYSGTVGVDAPLGDKFTVGVEGTVANLFTDNGREFGAGARIGYAVNPDFLVYGRAGYARLEDAGNRTLDGLSVGAGTEWRLSENTYLGTQYKYTDFERGVGSHGAYVSVGLRF